MLMQYGIVPLLLLSLKLLNKCTPTLFEMNKSSSDKNIKQPLILSLSSTKTIYNYKVMSFMAATIVVTLWCQILLIGTSNFNIIFESTFWAMMYTGHLAPVLEHLRKRQELCRLFNLFLIFESTHKGEVLNVQHFKIPTDNLDVNSLYFSAETIGRKGRKVTKSISNTSHMVKFYIVLGLLSLCLFPLLLYMFLLVKPCFPGNFGYFLIPECTRDLASLSTVERIIAFLIKVIIITFSTVLLKFTSTALVYEVMIFAIPQIFCLVSYLKQFNELLLTKHANVFNLNQMYHEIHILTIEYNNIHQNSLTIGLTIFISCTFIIPLYIVIAFGNRIPLIYLIFCSGCVFETGLYIVDCDGNMKSEVYRESKVVKEKSKSLKWVRTNKLCRRVVESWKVVKINIGAINFYDEQTALQMLNFNLTVVMNLLLL